MVKFLDYVDELQEKINKGNIFAPPIEDHVALEFLCDYLLGADWHVVPSLSHGQVNTEMVHAILYKYSRKYRKECKLRNKRLTDKDLYSKSI